MEYKLIRTHNASYGTFLYTFPASKYMFNSCKKLRQEIWVKNDLCSYKSIDKQNQCWCDSVSKGGIILHLQIGPRLLLGT